MTFKFLVAFCLLFIFSIASSQQNYFQQEVNYKIEVKLNDEKHELHAFESIEYINKSKETLNFIYFHLWPNAYKNNETALAKQLLEDGETKLYFAKEKDLGYIDSLNFRINGQPVAWQYDQQHIDICKLILNKPLAPGDTITITTPFHVKLPSAKLSRLGHIGQAYAITQWYPKPAVFDNEGWHQMPYLNQGEFYSEFGSFDVSITLPKNYLLAATGDRIDAQEEEEWLLKKTIETKEFFLSKNPSRDNSFPESSKELKTIRFIQHRVHDFAWFADKRFHVLKGNVKLPRSGNTIDTWAFFTNNETALWQNAIEYINDATLFYSDMNGDYPYNHVTAIDGTISAGGGMEYPNITIIGESGNAHTLETTIMHEVGHNWFYGILGSNERDFPFMDEGLNSFYEMRYIQQKYPNLKLTSIIGKDSTFNFFGLNKFKHKAQYEFSYLLSALKNTDQAIALPAEAFTGYNYGSIVYSKSALAFDYLMNYLGKEKFDEAMRFYFEQWKFKHPTPEDLIKTLQYYLNTDLQWFVSELLTTTKKIDYKIIKYKQLEDHSHAIVVKNNNTLLGPVSLSGLKNGKVIGTVLYNGFEGKKVFEFPPSDIDEFKIDYGQYIPELNRKNNNIKTSGIFKKSEPLQLNFLAKLDNQNYNQLNYLPIIGYNYYNNFMLGCALYNYSFLQKKIEFTIAPMYAFGSKSMTGFADLTRNFTLNNSIFQQITFTTKVKSFAHDYFDSAPFNSNTGGSIPSYYLNYYKITPAIDFELKKRNARSKINQHIGYTNTNLWVDNIKYIFTATTTNVQKTNTNLMINNLYYSLQNTRAINPFSTLLNFEHNDKFGKVSATFNYHITLSKNSTIECRLFVGAFVYGNTTDKGPYRFRMSGLNGYQDYLFDYNYVGRNAFNGLGFAQFIENDGAFKVWTPLGQTSKWLVALNVKSPKLGKLPLRIYADIGASEFNESLYKDKVLYNLGLNITILKNIMDVYIPLAYSNDIKKALEANNKSFFDAIRITLNLHNINPRKIISSNF